ncbi:MAG: TVP38/TMEM64 family protein [Blastocatellia bacterium]
MRYLKPMALCAVALTLLVCAAVLPVRDYLRELQTWLEQLGPWGPVALVVIYAALTVLMMPGSVLTSMSGFLFGLWTGTLAALAGANLGALLAFLLGRTLLRDKVAQWAAGNPKFAALDRAIGQAGFKMVFLARMSPAFPFVLLNYLLGLTRVTTRSYVLANLLGMLPASFMFVYFGVIAREALDGLASDAATGPYKKILTVIGLLATIAVVVLVTRIARRALAEAEQSGDAAALATAPVIPAEVK